MPAGLAEALKDRYAFQHELGRGGMATVYLATDLRHHRLVAVKVFGSDLTASVGASRFLREIGFCAQLHHPHILTLIDSGEADGFLFYVMPYVEGESLRQKLRREGRLPVPDGIRILRDVVDALAYAHGQRVVHRDVKPENVMLAGRHAWVVDFGLAKALSPALDRHDLTTTGGFLGTPAYMSPEQVASSAVDHRADIYAVGVVAYEVLTGHRPVTPAQRALIGDRAPDDSTPLPTPSAVEPLIPPELSSCVMRCLEDRAADRWQRADDLLAQLESLATPAPPTVQGSRLARTPVRRRFPWVGAGAAVLALALAVAVIARRPEVPPPHEFRQVTFDGNVTKARLSPDGLWLAYAKGSAIHTLVVRDLAGGSSIPLVDSVWVNWLRWSGDNARLAVGRGDGLLGTYLLPRLGGVPQRLSTLQGDVLWSPNGSRLIVAPSNTRFGILLSRPGSGEFDTVAVPGPDEVLESAAWAPQRDLLAVLTQASNFAAGHIWVVDLATGDGVLALVDSTSPPFSVHWDPAGDALYFARDGDLHRLAVDPRSGRATGAPQRLLRLEGGSAFSMSADARRLAYVRESGYVNYVLVSRRGDSVERTIVTSGTARKHCAVLAPNGRTVAFTQTTDEGVDLFRVPAAGGAPERLTFDGSAQVRVCPAWAPTGEALAYAARSPSGSRVAVLDLTSGLARLYETANVGEEVHWAPGSRIAYQVAGNRNYRLLDPATGDARRLVPDDSLGWMFGLRYSPDGRQAVIQWNRRGTPGLWLVPLEGASPVLLVPDDAGLGEPVAWAADGRSIYARTDGDAAIARFPLTGGRVPVRSPGAADTACVPYDLPQELVWLCAESRSTSDVWMVEGFEPGGARRPR